MQDEKSQSKELLEPASTVVVAATSTPFVVKDSFKNGKGIRFSQIWSEFTKRFFDKVEPPTGELTVRKYKLLRFAPDAPIIAELGGETKAESPLSAVFELVKRQASGADGFLQTTGYANIFYVKDKKGELCAVRVGWDGEGWGVDAISVHDPLAWNGKHEIFCPLRSTQRD